MNMNNYKRTRTPSPPADCGLIRPITVICVAVALMVAACGEKYQGTQGASALLDKAKDSLNDSRHELKTSVLSWIAQTQVEAGDAKGAEETAKGVLKAQGGLANIAESQIRKGDLAGAMRTAKRLSGTADGDSVILQVVQALAQEGDYNGAKATTVQIDRVAYKCMAFAFIAQKQSLDGDSKGTQETLSVTRELIGEVKDVGKKVKALAELACAEINAGDAEKAALTFDAATKTASSIKDDFERKYALLHISKAQAQTGNIKAAKRTAESIDDYLKDDALSAIALGQTKKLDFSEAKKTATLISAEWVKAKSLSEIATAQVENGDANGAKATASALIKMETRIFVFERIALAQVLAGDVNGAEEICAAAKEMVKNIQDLEKKASSLSRIARAYSETGNFKAALATCREAVITAHRQRAKALKSPYSHDPFWYGIQLMNIAQTQARSGDIDGALALAKKESDIVKAQVFLGVARGIFLAEGVLTEKDLD